MYNYLPKAIAIHAIICMHFKDMLAKETIDIRSHIIGLHLCRIFRGLSIETKKISGCQDLCLGGKWEYRFNEYGVQGFFGGKEKIWELEEVAIQYRGYTETLLSSLEIVDFML